MEPVTPEQFSKEMRRLHERFYSNSPLEPLQEDRERVHGLMDDVMCKTLISLGYGEGVSIFYDTPKWYA